MPTARSISRRSSLLLAALVSACGFHNVQVRHFNLGEKTPLEASAALARVQVVMRLPEPASPVLGGDKTAWKAAKQLIKKSLKESKDFVARPLDRNDARAALVECARRLRTPYSWVAGYQIQSGGGEPPLLAAVKPTAVLTLEPSELSGSRSLRSVSEEKTTKKDGEETKETVTKTVSDVKASFTLKYRLTSWPEGRLLAEGSYPSEFKTTRDGEADLAYWMATNEKGWALAWIDPLARDLLPHPVDRQRSLRQAKSGPMKSAFKAAKAGKWDDARALWESEAAKGDWEAESNLGVESERRGDFPAAAVRYRSALAKTKRSIARDELTRWLGDLDRAAALPAPVQATVSTFFGSGIAVMPFSNDSIDPEAADVLRKKVKDRLVRARYEVRPLEETDSRMRDIGVSMGEHFRALKPGAAGQAAGAPLLLYGTVEEFNMVNAGIYRRKLVRLVLRLTDAAGNELWAGRGEGFREEASSLSDAGQDLLLGIGEKLVLKAFRSFLNDEANIAADHATDSLPALPPVPGS